MLITISIIAVSLAIISLINISFFTNQLKIVTAIFTTTFLLYFENSNYSFFFISNVLLTFILYRIENVKFRIISYTGISLIFFYSSFLGSLINNTFLTFYFSETPYLANTIYCLPFVLLSLGYLEQKDRLNLHMDFKINQTLKLFLLLFFLCSIGHPFIKTMGALQSLNFFQSIILLVSISSIIYITTHILKLFTFKEVLTFSSKNKTEFFVLLGSVLIVNISIIHIIIGVLVISMNFLLRKSHSLILKLFNFFLIGILFLPDLHSIKTIILGLLSVPSILLYYNELYILNSIGADITLFIPLLLIFSFWIKNKNKLYFDLINTENKIKTPQFLIICVLILFIF